MEVEKEIVRTAMEALCLELADAVCHSPEASIRWCSAHNVTWMTGITALTLARADIDKRIADAEYAAQTRSLPYGCKWPMFDDGELVKLGDMAVDISGDVFEVAGVEINSDTFTLHDTHGLACSYLTNQRVKRQEPSDSWEQLDKDVDAAIANIMRKYDACGADVQPMLDLVARAKRLAEASE